MADTRVLENGTDERVLENGTDTRVLELDVTFDAFSPSGEFSTTNPVTWTHTPVGVPRGVYVGIVANSGSDLIDGVVSYGGVAMTRVEESLKGVSEAGGAYVYFLGSGIPTGPQTVSISHTGSSAVKIAGCITVTATDDTTIDTTGVISSGSIEDPQIPLDTGAEYGLRITAAMTGHGAVSAHSPNAGHTQDLEHLFSPAATTALIYHQTNRSTGSVNGGYQSTGNDDSVAVGVAITRGAPAGLTGGATDPLGLEDSVAAVQAAARSQADPLGLEDTASAAQAAARSQTDPAGLSDSVVAQLVLPFTTTDPLGLADSLDATEAAARGATDPLPATDTLTSVQGTGRAALDPLTLEDGLSAAQAATRGLGDPESLSDATAAVQASQRGESDSLGLTDALTFQLVLPFSATDPLGLADTASAAQAAARSQADPAGLADTLARIQAFTRGALDALGLSDSLGTTAEASRGLDDLSGLTDSIVVDVGPTAAFITPDPIDTGPGAIPMAPAGILSPGAGFTITPDPIPMTPDPPP